MSLSEARDAIGRAFSFDQSGCTDSAGTELFAEVGPALKTLPYGHPARREFRRIKQEYSRATWKAGDEFDASDFPFVDDDVSRRLMMAVKLFLRAMDREIGSIRHSAELPRARRGRRPNPETQKRNAKLKKLWRLGMTGAQLVEAAKNEGINIPRTTADNLVKAWKDTVPMLGSKSGN